MRRVEVVVPLEDLEREVREDAVEPLRDFAVLVRVAQAAEREVDGLLEAAQRVPVAPPERAGAVSAISETGAELGGALGIAMLGSVGLAVYRIHLADTLPPALTSAQEHAASRTLADATSTSAQLTQPASGELVHAAAAAFTDSLQTGATAAAAITLLIALLAAALLRTATPAAEQG